MQILPKWLVGVHDCLFEALSRGFSLTSCPAKLLVSFRTLDNCSGGFFLHGLVEPLHDALLDPAVGSLRSPAESAESAGMKADLATLPAHPAGEPPVSRGMVNGG